MDHSRGRGFHLLAELMSWAPNLAVLPRFRSMNMLNLLLLQAEISELEDDLTEWVNLDERSGESERVRLSCNLSTLRKCRERWKAYQLLRSKLEEYSKISQVLR